ncbi:thioredoxin [Lacihabitans sp. LS3-19]|uniref:thioredoxin domain-containing protein n=1 Tax=Lacihabitans sp. LS3-19 TaxID=2487335 RepID=UPI0020CC34FE|nr:thioredoxin domain-containing protein [Lacihabitans sp. LS3-19]MCP9767733.1 thioredoxin [Lacihabitans sp. LS3-19]
MKKITFLLLFISHFLIAQNAATILFPNDFEKSTRQNANIPLLDIRSKGEFEAGHIKKAIHVDYLRADFEDYMKQAFPKKSPLFIYCQTGQSSQDAAQYLSEIGYENITILKGGFEKWISNSKPYKSSQKGFTPLGFISNDNYDLMVKNNKYVLVDFYADWCGPCKKMAPILRKIDDESIELSMVKIDADKNTSLTETHEVSEIPTLILYKNGKQIWRHTGLITENEIKSKIH